MSCMENCKTLCGETGSSQLSSKESFGGENTDARFAANKPKKKQITLPFRRLKTHHPVRSYLVRRMGSRAFCGKIILWIEMYAAFTSSFTFGV